MDKTYVEQRDGGYYVAGERVSLDSLVYAFRRVSSPESIRRSFPSSRWNRSTEPSPSMLPSQNWRKGSF
jgi:hypothetical protein